MVAAYRTPGVYREEVFVRDAVGLVTGVPAFIGFADAPAGGKAPDVPVALSRYEDLSASFAAQAGSYLDAAVAGFFLNGGAQCYVLRAQAGAFDPLLQRQMALSDAVDALDAIDDLDLVVVPDAMALLGPTGVVDPVAARYVQQRMLAHCAGRGDRFALLDPLPGLDGPAVLNQRAALTVGAAEPVSGALYYPWLLTEDNRWIPPCGHIAGVYARSDARAGVFKAPANERLYGVVDLQARLDDDAQGDLNLNGVNGLRAFPGRGLRVWGARTLSRDPAWAFVNVRRLLLTVGRWIALNLAWAGFEPNTPLLWVRISRELQLYLEGLWSAGALAGATREQAYYVQCDARTNPPEMREAGQCVTELALAPALPAEFVRIRIVHRAGATDFLPAAAAA